MTNRYEEAHPRFGILGALSLSDVPEPVASRVVVEADIRSQLDPPLECRSLALWKSEISSAKWGRFCAVCSAF